MNAEMLEQGWFKTARQTKQRMDVRFYMLRESPMTPNDGRMILEVSGVPFDDSGKSMRSKLKSLGFWFDRQKGNWIIDSGSPTEFNLEKNKKWSKHRANQDKAFPLVKQIATEHNKTVVIPYNDALKKMAPGAPTKFKNILKSVDSRRRRESWLQSAGIEYKYTAPSGRYDFFEAFVAFSGNTYHIKDILKSFGFKWKSSSKAWVMPYVEWTLIESKFFAAAGKQIQSMVRQPAQSAQGIFETMSKQELGALVLRFMKKTYKDWTNPFEMWFAPQDEADREVPMLHQVKAVSDYLKEQKPDLQQKMHDKMIKGDGKGMERLVGGSQKWASQARLIVAWDMLEEPAPTAALRIAAFKPLPDMVDKLVLYFQTVRMKPRDMLRNMQKDPLSADSVIKIMQLGLRKTGWAKMWWPKKDADWQILMKAVADASW